MIFFVSLQHIENRTYPMSEESEHYYRHHFFSESFELYDLGFAIFPPAPVCFSSLSFPFLLVVFMDELLG